MTHKEIFVEMSTMFTRDGIIRCARNDREKPMGFLLSYIKDIYGLPKAEGFDIAEDLLKFFNIDNETMGKIY